MSVTIEDVMAVAVSYGYGPRKWTDELRASIEALVAQARDEEAEACAEVAIAHFGYSTDQGGRCGLIVDAIRARIAARKGGA
mgnify:CR=1 FL=1